MLSKEHRFHGLGSLNFAYKQGKTVRAPMLSLKYARNPRRATYRVAVVVSRKVNKSAVVRNRIRRRVYEALQASGEVTGPYDLLFTVFNEQVTEAAFTDLQKQMQDLLKKAGVQRPSQPPAHGIVSTEGKVS